MENGLTGQFGPTVARMPRQCPPTRCRPPKSLLSSMGTTMSQIRPATGRFTRATAASPMAWNTPGASWPRPTPAGMHGSTRTVRNRSKAPMAGRDAAAGAAVRVALTPRLLPCSGA